MSDLAIGDCGVCIGGDGGGDDVCEFWLEKMIKARKPHKCYECDGAIVPGSVYERIVYKYEGNFECIIICALCSEIGRAFSCGGRQVGTLWEQVHEDLFPNMTTGCLVKLTTAAAKQHLVNKWNEWKFGKTEKS
jgi:hypothetical protein